MLQLTHTLVSGTSSATLGHTHSRRCTSVQGTRASALSQFPGAGHPRAVDGHCGGTSCQAWAPSFLQPPRAGPPLVPGERRHGGGGVMPSLLSGTCQRSSPDPPTVTLETRPAVAPGTCVRLSCSGGGRHAARGCGGQDAEGPSSQRPEPTVLRPAGAAGGGRGSGVRVWAAARALPGAWGWGLPPTTGEGRRHGPQPRPHPEGARGSGPLPGSLCTGHSTPARGLTPEGTFLTTAGPSAR